MIAPITVRNLAVAGDPVQIASQGGINLYLGNNDAADGLSAVMPEPLGYNWQIRDITYIAERHLGRPLKPGEVSGYWAAEAITWMLDNPGHCAKLYLSKLYHAVSNREISNNRDLGSFFNNVALLRLNPLSFGLIFALACLGIVAGFRRNRHTRLIVGLILIYTAAASLFFFNSRFRLPLLPFYFLLAAAGLEFIRHQWQSRSGSLLPAVLTAVVAGIVSYVPLVALPSGTSPQALMSRALFLYERGEYQASLSLAREAAAIDSTFTDVNLAIGNAYLRLGDGTARGPLLRPRYSLPPRPARAPTATWHRFDFLRGVPKPRSLCATGRSPFGLTMSRPTRFCSVRFLRSIRWNRQRSYRPAPMQPPVPATMDTFWQSSAGCSVSDNWHQTLKRC